MSEGQLEQALKVGEVYDCKVISSYGHERKINGIYLGKSMGSKKQLHGVVFTTKNPDKVELIKFSKVRLYGNVLEIRSPIRVYGISENEEAHYLSTLKQRGLQNES